LASFRDDGKTFELSMATGGDDGFSKVMSVTKGEGDTIMVSPSKGKPPRNVHRGQYHPWYRCTLRAETTADGNTKWVYTKEEEK